MIRGVWGVVSEIWKNGERAAVWWARRVDLDGAQASFRRRVAQGDRVHLVVMSRMPWEPHVCTAICACVLAWMKSAGELTIESKQGGQRGESDESVR